MVKKQATLTTRSRHAETRPVIIAPDYTDDELYEWMHQKIKAVQDLKWANEARAKQAENLSALEQDITNLEKAAALSIARMITYPR
ncbi:putative prophage protein [Escherichia coli]|nr:putative prophage protein [Escherichia coli]